MKLIQGAALAAAAVITMAGCAAIDRQEAADAEQLLAQSGFNQVPANSASREQDLKDIQPRQLFARTRNGETRYVFADPYNCNCFYVGGEKEYAQLQSLRKASIADHRRLEAEEGSDRQVADDLWGPWNPEGLVAK